LALLVLDRLPGGLKASLPLLFLLEDYFALQLSYQGLHIET
jgi:hypothetical protein